MKVLLATAKYPTTDRPSAGIFVRNQFRFFRKHATPEEKFVLFRVRTYSRKNTQSFFRTLWSTITFLPHFFRRYDIIHVHSLSPLIRVVNWYKFLRPDTRLLLTLHGGGLLNFSKARASKKKRYKKYLRKFDEIILSGESLIQSAHEELGADSCRIICAGVDDLRFHTVDNVTKEYDFVFVGSFTQSRGVDVLLAALNMLEDKEIRVCFIGSGPLQQELKRAGHHLDIQIFADVPQTRLRQLYCASRFLIFPSHVDGFGLVVTEAMYCGVPAIIYSDSGAGAQVQSNETGLCYKPNTPEKLSRALRSAVNMPGDDYRRMVANLSDANLEYSLSHVGTRLMKLYRQINAEKDLSS